MNPIPPLSTPRCSFGPFCCDPNGARLTGPEICPCCKNKSTQVLYELAKRLNNPRLQTQVSLYRSSLSTEAALARSQGKFLCAMRDPEYADRDWRHDFDPKRGTTPCNDPVAQQGLLCRSCEEQVRVQIQQDAHALPAIREQFEECRILGFECVMWDPRYENTERNVRWKFGIDGAHRVSQCWKPLDPTWCARATARDRLCGRCYARLHPRSQFGRYFTSEEGALRSKWRDLSGPVYV